MNPPDDDLGIWKWAIGVALSVFSGVIGGVWTARSVLAGLEHTDDDHEKRIKANEANIKALEAKDKERIDFCDKRKAELLAELAKEVCNVVKIAIKDVTIENNNKLAVISTNQALQGQLLQQIQSDVEAIFGRMNRRGSDGDEHGGVRKNRTHDLIL